MRGITLLFLNIIKFACVFIYGKKRKSKKVIGLYASAKYSNVIGIYMWAFQQKEEQRKTQKIYEERKQLSSFYLNLILHMMKFYPNYFIYSQRTVCIQKYKQKTMCIQKSKIELRVFFRVVIEHYCGEIK